MGNHRRHQDNRHRRSGSYRSNISEDSSENPHRHSEPVSTSNALIQKIYVNIKLAFAEARSLNDNRFIDVKNLLEQCETHLRSLHHEEQPSGAEGGADPGYDHGISVTMGDLTSCKDMINQVEHELKQELGHFSHQHLHHIGATPERLKHIFDNLVYAEKTIDSIIKQHHYPLRRDSDPEHHHYESPDHSPNRRGH